MKNFIFVLVGLLYFGCQIHIIKYQNITFKNGETRKLPRHIIINTIFPEQITKLYRFYLSKKQNKEGIPIKIEFI